MSGNSRLSRYIKTANDIKAFKQHAATSSLTAQRALEVFRDNTELVCKALKISGIDDNPLPLVKMLGDVSKSLNTAIGNLAEIEKEHPKEVVIKSSKSVRRFEEVVMHQLIAVSTEQMEVTLSVIAVVLNAGEIVAEHEKEVANG